jgi:putative membrane protein
MFITTAAAYETARFDPQWGSGSSALGPHLGVVMCLIPLLIAGILAFVLMRRFGPPPWMRGGRSHQRPHTGGPTETADDTARRVLAERFAKGDISVEEFLERASALNWYPGTESGKG